MIKLLNLYISVVILINTLSICISEAFTLFPLKGSLNQPLREYLNSSHGFQISYDFKICKIKFLQIILKTELKRNEILSIKSNTEKCERQIENRNNLSEVIEKIIFCSPLQLKGCGNYDYLGIELRTNAMRNIEVSINASLINDFTINIGDNRSNITIDVYSPVYYLLKFNDSNEDMEVKIKSDDDFCMHAFVEKAECSVNILTPNIESERVKTITKTGAIIIRNRDEYVKNHLFLAFKLSDSCGQDVNVLNGKYYQKKFDISFLNVVTNYMVISQSWILFLVFLFGGIIYTVIYIALWFCDENRYDKFRLWCKLYDQGRIGKCECLKNGYFKCWSANYFFPSKYIIIISIFYILPTVQLLYHFYNTMNIHGNFDNCFYNDLCSKPHGIFMAFNNVISNMGYLFMGFFFIIIVAIRHCFSFYDKNVSSIKYSISPNYGIFYAFGFSLMIEGLISGIYHICPRSDTIQFDSTFMYIIGCFLNLYYAIQLMTIFETYTDDNTLTFNSNDNIIIMNSKENTLTIKSKNNESGTNNDKQYNILYNSNDNSKNDISVKNISKYYTIIIDLINNSLKINSRTIDSTDYPITIKSKNDIIELNSNNIITTNSDENKSRPDNNKECTGENESKYCMVRTKINKGTKCPINYSMDIKSTVERIKAENKSKIVKSDNENERQTLINTIPIQEIEATEPIESKDNKATYTINYTINVNSLDQTIPINSEDREEIENSENEPVCKISVNILLQENEGAISEDKSNYTIEVKSVDLTNSTNSEGIDNSTEYLYNNKIINIKEHSLIFDSTENKGLINSEYLTIKLYDIEIKEMLFYMSIIILGIILLLIYEENLKKKIQQYIFIIIILIIQCLIIVLYTRRIFFLSRTEITYSVQWRWFYFLVIVIINCIFSVICLIFDKFISIYLYFLLVFIVNFVLLSGVFYCIIFNILKKLRKCKYILCKLINSRRCPSISCSSKCSRSNILKIVFIWANIIGASILLVLALIAFFQAPTDWHKSPSLSREKNKDCIFLDYYDIHDIWHFASSCACFLIFMSIFLIDGWIYENRNLFSL